MTIATTSAEGEIVLGGDLTGTATYPELRATGVIPGTYAPVQRMTVDAKGRVVSVGALTPEEVAALLLTATSSVKGLFSVGTNLIVVDGAVSVSRPSLVATSGTNGLVSVGNGFAINGAGVLSIPDASAVTKGIASFSGTDFAVSSGAVGILDYSAFSAQLVPATGSVFGVVKSGTNITNTAGVLSVPDATTSVKGVASFNSTQFTVSGGTVSCPTEAKTNVANTYTKSNAGSVQTVSGGSTYTPDFQTGETVADITLNQNLTINFPSVLAPAGTVVRRNIVLRYNAGTAYTVTLSGTYLTNKTLTFTNAASAAVDNLTLICTSTVCYAILNETFL